MKPVRPSLRLAILLAVAGGAPLVWAEYGDVIMNERSSAEGVAPVIFPHWFHRIRFQCSVCHVDLGFRMQAGGNGVSMQDITDGRFCGACHDGKTAWQADRCDLCHSGKGNLVTGVKGGHQTAGPGIY